MRWSAWASLVLGSTMVWIVALGACDEGTCGDACADGSDVQIGPVCQHNAFGLYSGVECTAALASSCTGADGGTAVTDIIPTMQPQVCGASDMPFFVTAMPLGETCTFTATCTSSSDAGGTMTVTVTWGLDPSAPPCTMPNIRQTTVCDFEVDAGNDGSADAGPPYDASDASAPSDASDAD